MKVPYPHPTPPLPFPEALTGCVEVKGQFSVWCTIWRKALTDGRRAGRLFTGAPFCGTSPETGVARLTACPLTGRADGRDGELWGISRGCSTMCSVPTQIYQDGRRVHTRTVHG